MNKSTAALVWVAGFIVLSLFLTKIPGKEGFFIGFFSGLVWTTIVLSMTKKEQHGSR